jgi:hypothetical protein
MDGLVPGRIVHWVFSGVHYPAIVIRVCDKESGGCILRAFGDFPEDDERVDTIYNKDFKNDTWHWIERE